MPRQRRRRASSILLQGSDQSLPTWRLEERDLAPGDVLELRLSLPQLWLPVWVEGLPRAPVGCLMAANGAVVPVPLFPGTRLRWPTSPVDPRLTLMAHARARSALIHDFSRSFFGAFEDVGKRLDEILTLLERHDRYLSEYCRALFGCMYPEEVAALSRKGSDEAPSVL